MTVKRSKGKVAYSRRMWYNNNVLSLNYWPDGANRPVIPFREGGCYETIRCFPVTRYYPSRKSLPKLHKAKQIRENHNHSQSLLWNGETKVWHCSPEKLSHS